MIGVINWLSGVISKVSVHLCFCGGGGGGGAVRQIVANTDRQSNEEGKIE